VQALFRRNQGAGRLDALQKLQATEEGFRRLAPQHRFLHLATHGFFAPPELRSALNVDISTGDNFNGETRSSMQNVRATVAGFHPGLLSGLVLAGANRPLEPDKDDGILTALEVAELDLSGVELATLSACETGLGESAGGEGLLGLQRAFQVAGARTVVASLWQVPDQATRTLMTRFYENLWQKKLSKLEALREAQIWMLREGVKQPELWRGLGEAVKLDSPAEVSPGRRDLQGLPPRYWAAFVLSGDWR
jgi:CHAT domain-containing protein